MERWKLLKGENSWRKEKRSMPWKMARLLRKETPSRGRTGGKRRENARGDGGGRSPRRDVLPALRKATMEKGGRQNTWQRIKRSDFDHGEGRLV